MTPCKKLKMEKFAFYVATFEQIKIQTDLAEQNDCITLFLKIYSRVWNRRSPGINVASSLKNFHIIILILFSSIKAMRSFFKKIIID